MTTQITPRGFYFPSIMGSNIIDELFRDSENSIFDYDLSIPYDMETKLNAQNEPQEQILTFALAGYKKEQINVKVVDDKLTLAINKVEKTENDATTIVHHKGICQRSIQMKWSNLGMIDKKNIKTKFADGLLTITLPFMAKEETVIDIE